MVFLSKFRFGVEASQSIVSRSRSDIEDKTLLPICKLQIVVALDVLPVQASSIPCERAFSSSKETCVMRRSLLSTGMLEVLQVLKQLYKAERLDFTSSWIANEEDYSIEKATEAAINELVSSAKCDELLDLLQSMDSTQR
jgi:hypothetical protein